MQLEDGEFIDEIFYNMLPEILEEFRVQSYLPSVFFWIFNQIIVKVKGNNLLKRIK